VDVALFASALLLGLAGAPHCAAMCAPGCGALLRGCGAAAQPAVPLSFHLARIAGYAAAGAVAASSVGVLEQWSRSAPVLRPLWILLHAAALGLGLWLLWTGRQPAWLENLGRGGARAAPTPAGGWQRLHGPGKAAATGTLWVAWPCGLLQSALLVAALANGAWSGAAVMAGFAAVSAAGLAVAPWAFGRLVGGGPAATVQAGRAALWAVRFGGAVLAAASAWALGQDLIRRAVAYCFG
jgi:hypothetical protein